MNEKKMHDGRTKDAPLILCILGPTAIGKTRLVAEALSTYSGDTTRASRDSQPTRDSQPSHDNQVTRDSQASHEQGIVPVVISCDSRQIYQGLQIATCGPDEKLKTKIPHFLVDFLSPEKRYSAAAFEKDATALIAKSLKRQQIPFIVGGSGFYFKALQHGVFPIETTNAKAAAQIQKMTHEQKLQQLEKIDPDALDPSANHCIHPNDQYRLERALLIALGSNGLQRWSQLWKQHALTQELRKKLYCFECYTLPIPENYSLVLKERIVAMLDNGLIDEAQASFDHYGLSHGFKAAGHSIVLEYMQKMIDRETLIDRLTSFHYQIARKQRKWFSKMTSLKIMTQPELFALIRERLYGSG